MGLRIHIDELRLDGFDPRLRFRIADAIERELSRLFESAEDAAPRVAERVDAGAFAMTHGESPEQIGASIARAVFAGMCPDEGR